MSTNDTVLLLASGASGRHADRRASSPTAVTAVCADLARQLIADAEGAAHDIAIEVRSAPRREADAVEVGPRRRPQQPVQVRRSSASDPNWGRVLAAVGTTARRLRAGPRSTSSINGVRVCRAGGVGEDRALVDLEPRARSTWSSTCTPATRAATVWTNDLTHDYVHENSRVLST